MDVNRHFRFEIPDRSFSSLAKRDITRLVESYGFSQTLVGKVNIIASELISNLIKHSSSGGELLVKPIGKPVRGLEILCFDQGPGMSDPQRMLEDGVSTYGSAGEGLGAIKRQSDEFDMYSSPGIGTFILSRIYTTPQKKTDKGLPYEIGTVMVPMPSEMDCGDGYAVYEKDDKIFLIALDGLGHGTHAHEASKQAVDIFCSSPGTDPANTLRTIHNSIKRTRGAVGLAMHISPGTNSASYCGVGNIAGKLFSADGGTYGTSYKNIMSYNGILGHNIPTTLTSQQVEWGRGKLLVLHSDGLKTRWDLSKYPNLQRHHTSIIAAVLYKENRRNTDDSLVIVCKAKI